MYRLSNLAAKDFEAIYEYTWRRFGPLQADKYTNELDGLLKLLARNPLMGRDCQNLIDGARRHADDAIFVIRILHQQMDPLRHFR